MNTVSKLVLFFNVFFVLVNKMPGQAIDEYTLKAVWIAKFPHFIDWPKNDIDTSQFFNIGIWGNDPFNGQLDSLCGTSQINGKKVDVEVIYHESDLEQIDLLFVPAGNKQNIESLLNECSLYHLLIICEEEGVAELGAHINFIIVNNKVRFEINEKALRDTGFFVSFRLLNISKIVKPIVNQ